MTQVLVVEDQRTLADALEIAINAQPDLVCVGAVGTVEEAIPLLADADVVLMDIGLPGTDGIEGTRRITASAPEVRVLILTANAGPISLADAVAAGAEAFLAKDSALPDILTAIRTPVSGKLLVEGNALTALTERTQPTTAPSGGERDQSGLTARERQVLDLLGEGLDAGAIAQRLVVSNHTARGHVKSILRKLGAHSQLEAVVLATRAGLLSGPTVTRRTT